MIGRALINHSLRLFAAALIAGSAGAALAQPGGMPPAPVLVQPASVEELAPVLKVPGTVFSRDSSVLSIRVDGTLAQVVEIGSRVTAGDTVAQLDNPFLGIAVREAAAEVSRGDAQTAFLAREVERLARLAASNNAAKNQLDAAENDLATARADLAAARARLSTARTADALATVRAPFDGEITERMAMPGEFITAGTQVVRLVSTDRLEVVVRAPLKSVRRVRPGARVRVEGDGGNGEGVVTALVPFGDPADHMYELRAALESGDWLVGEDVRLAVPQAPAQTWLAVPRDALVLRRDGSAVYRVGEDNTAERIEVTTGVSDGDLIAVEGDLSPGDLIIIRGAERLRPGQAVGVIENASAGG